VVELITRDACSLSSVGDGHERWRRALRALRMSAAQQEQLLLLRASHLVRMRAIYQERQELNMQVRKKGREGRGGRGQVTGWLARVAWASVARPDATPPGPQAMCLMPRHNRNPNTTRDVLNPNARRRCA
jgi:hypothetical protein